MLNRPRSSLAVASTLATLVLAACGSELPKDKGVWYICNVSASEETVSLPGQPNGSAVTALFQTRVCGNPGLPPSDITGACIEQCENDLGSICLGVSDDFELFMCEPECATIGFLQTSEDCRNASIVPGPPTAAQAEVTLDDNSRASVSIEDEGSGDVTPDGVLRYTAIPCATPPCIFRLAAFRFTTPEFEIDGNPITGALVQSAGLAEGTIDAAGNFIIPPGRVRVSVNFNADGEHGSITLTNTSNVEGHTNPAADVFTVIGQFSQDDVIVNLNLSGLHTNRPPVAAFSPAGNVECTSPQGAAVILQSTSTDPDGAADIGFQRWRIGPFFAGAGPQLPFTLPFGPTAVGLSVVDGSLARDGKLQTLTVVDTTPPVVTAPPDTTIECAGPTGTSVSLGTATASDVCDASPTLVNNAPAVFPLGITTVTWTARDAHNKVGSDTQVVRIADTTPPELTVALSPSVLFPPNHKLATITASITVRDACDTNPTVRLVSITSNEADNGLGDGNTPVDILSAAFNTDDRSFQLRSERSGPNTGRVYTVVYEAADASGNTTRREATVTVPKSQGH